MNSGYILKSSSSNEVTAEELALINIYSRKMLTKNDVYVFSVVLCDNEIDRDFERFTKEALETLSKLFVGKTGILDHEMKAKNQTARTISCKVEEISGRVTALGEQYYRLVARAYMVKSEKNNSMILDIDSGIKKEVSISCSVKRMECSICGCNIKTSPCRHIKGNTYDENGELQNCFVTLDEPTDAYEWSFVAVPAQREAGVIKAFNENAYLKSCNVDAPSFLKKAKNLKELYLTNKQLTDLLSYVKKLQDEAKDGKIYKEDLKSEVFRLYKIAQPDLDKKIMQSVLNKMNTAELKEFKRSLTKKADAFIKPTPQLLRTKNEKEIALNEKFKI